MYSSLDFAGVSQFQVRYAMKGSQKLNVKVVLGVTKNGVYIYEYPSMEKKALYTYKQMRSWRRSVLH